MSLEEDISELTLNELEDDDISILSEENTPFDMNIDIIASNHSTYEEYYTKNKKTQPFITKYEKTKLLGVRAQMLASGSPAMVFVPSHITNTLDIAEMEYKEKKIPLLIRRNLPNKQFEDWRLKDLII
jgi:DNA-directed RNA polymerase subunit K/omega